MPASSGSRVLGGGSSPGPAGTDRILPAGAAKAVIAAQFPAFRDAELTSLGHGWDFDAYRVTETSGAAWVFRFPRRRDTLDQLSHELRVLPAINAALANITATPRCTFNGQPDASFPYPFAGYQFIPGMPAHPTRQRPATSGFMRRLAAALAALHAIDTGKFGLTADQEPPAAWLEEVRQRQKLIATALGPALWKPCRTWLAAVTPPSARPIGESALIHDDLCPDHVLVHGDGSLAGIIDFGDATLGDRARDLGYLAYWLGSATADAVLAHYREVTARPLSANEDDRIRFFSRIMPLVWIGETICESQMHAHIGKHRGWVARAFGVDD